MARRVDQRLQDIIDAILNIEALLEGKGLADVNDDTHVRAAFERYMEIVSEASRHVPAEMKAGAHHIPWQAVAHIGNILRHVYHRVDPSVLWTTFERGDLEELKLACLVLLKKT